MGGRTYYIGKRLLVFYEPYKIYCIILILNRFDFQIINTAFLLYIRYCLLHVYPQYIIEIMTGRVFCISKDYV